MRNYCKFRLVSGFYDDGGGGSLGFTNWFLNAEDAASYFALFPLPWLPGQPAINQDLWVGLDKILVRQILNLSVGSGLYIIPPPPAVFTSSPKNIGVTKWEWGNITFKK
jgi:hypothetical protein